MERILVEEDTQHQKGTQGPIRNRLYEAVKVVVLDTLGLHGSISFHILPNLQQAWEMQTVRLRVSCEPPRGTCLECSGLPWSCQFISDIAYLFKRDLRGLRYLHGTRKNTIRMQSMSRES